MADFVEDGTQTNEPEHEIENPVAECAKLQRRYYRCVKKFAGNFAEGVASEDTRDVCLNRFDEFRECVEDAAKKMLAQQEQKSDDSSSWW